MRHNRKPTEPVSSCGTQCLRSPSALSVSSPVPPSPGLQLFNPLQPERPWYEAISPYTTEADVFACANTIVDFYELIAPKMDRDEPGRKSEVNLSPSELQRIRESTGGTTSLPARAPLPAGATATAETMAAAKRMREESTEGNGTDGNGEASKHRRAASSAPTSSPPRAEAAAPRPDDLDQPAAL